MIIIVAWISLLGIVPLKVIWDWADEALSVAGVAERPMAEPHPVPPAPRVTSASTPHT
jgi:hypothetical protein